MKMLGIDFGSKRVGLALTDEGGVMAFPYAVIPNDEKLLKAVEAVIEKERVARVVIGHSIDKMGKANHIHEAAEAFMLDLTLATGLPIELEPELYTTQEALRVQGRTKLTDAAAATIILNSYLERQRYQI